LDGLGLEVSGLGLSLGVEGSGLGLGLSLEGCGLGLDVSGLGLKWHCWPRCRKCKHFQLRKHKFVACTLLAAHLVNLLILTFVFAVHSAISL